ncbi:MAG: hypothetical protein AAB223_11470 [Pseudomonadota bacterium]
MQIPVLSGWWRRRRERRYTREIQAATVACDLTRAQVAAALNARVLEETVASVASQRRRNDTIVRAAAAKVQAASGCFPPQAANGRHHPA